MSIVQNIHQAFAKRHLCLIRKEKERKKERKEAPLITGYIDLVRRVFVPIDQRSGNERPWKSENICLPVELRMHSFQTYAVLLPPICIVF